MPIITFDEYITKRVSDEWRVGDNAEATETAAITDEAKAFDASVYDTQLLWVKAKEVADFLTERYQRLQLKRVTTKKSHKYNVSKLLRRNSKSNETRLTLFDKFVADDNGDLTIDESQINIVDKIIKLVAQVLGSFGVLLLVISGVIMILSQGEESYLQKAKQTFAATLIGLIVAFMSYTIVRFIIELLLTR